MYVFSNKHNLVEADSVASDRFSHDHRAVSGENAVWGFPTNMIRFVGT